MTTETPQKVAYPKPHTTYDEQVQRLVDRGLVVADRDAMKRLLAAVGYYRFTAYVYPFREMLPEEEQRKQSPTHYRRETIAAGTTFELVESVWRFDRNLRHTVLDAVETIEVGLKSRIAYVVGRRHPMAHVLPEHLDKGKAMGPFWGEKRSAETRHERWMRGYDAEIERAREDFIVHNLHKYEELPIWIGLGPASFGQVVDLFAMLKDEDQHEIATDLGIRNGKMLGNWLAALRYLRNEAAHHSRMWNRVRTFGVQRPKESQVGAELAHLAQANELKKIYATLAIAAYLVRRIDAKSNFHNNVKTRVRKFERDTGMSPQEHMDFPEGWGSLALWGAASSG